MAEPQQALMAPSLSNSLLSASQMNGGAGDVHPLPSVPRLDGGKEPATTLLHHHHHKSGGLPTKRHASPAAHRANCSPSPPSSTLAIHTPMKRLAGPGSTGAPSHPSTSTQMRRSEASDGEEEGFLSTSPDSQNGEIIPTKAPANGGSNSGSPTATNTTTAATTTTPTTNTSGATTTSITSSSAAVTPACILTCGNEKNCVTLRSILDAFKSPLSEEHSWALLYQVVSLYRSVAALNRRYIFSDLEIPDALANICIHRDGTVHCTWTPQERSVKEQKMAELERQHDSGAVDEGDDRSQLIATHKRILSQIAVIIYSALDYNLQADEQCPMSPDLEDLITHMTADGENDDDCIDEGIEDGYKRWDDEIDDEKFTETKEFDYVLEACKNHIKPTVPEVHYTAVCRALVTETIELKIFLQHVLDEGAANLKTDSNTSKQELAKLGFNDWARFWVQVIDELRRGVRLKKSNYERVPTEYELTPYEILMEDIRSKKYQLRKVMVNGDIPPRVKKDAHALILDFIRSRPPLKKASERKLPPPIKRTPSPREQLMDSIRKGQQLKHITPPASIRLKERLCTHIPVTRDVHSSCTQMNSNNLTNAPKSRKTSISSATAKSAKMTTKTTSTSTTTTSTNRKTSSRATSSTPHRAASPSPTTSPSDGVDVASDASLLCGGGSGSGNDSAEPQPTPRAAPRQGTNPPTPKPRSVLPPGTVTATISTFSSSKQQAAMGEHTTPRSKQRLIKVDFSLLQDDDNFLDESSCPPAAADTAAGNYPGGSAGIGNGGVCSQPKMPPYPIGGYMPGSAADPSGCGAPSKGGMPHTQIPAAMTTRVLRRTKDPYTKDEYHRFFDNALESYDLATQCESRRASARRHTIVGCQSNLDETQSMPPSRPESRQSELGQSEHSHPSLVDNVSATKMLHNTYNQQQQQQQQQQLKRSQSPQVQQTPAEHELSSRSSSSVGPWNKSFLDEKTWNERGDDRLSLTLEEIVHIRSVMTKAELEGLPVGVRVKEDVEKRKVCFLCLRTRFSIFGPWGIQCKLCQRTVCSKCYTKMRIPSEHFRNVPLVLISPSLLASPAGSSTPSPSHHSYYHHQHSSSTGNILDETFPKSLIERLLRSESERKTRNSVGSAPSSPKHQRSNMSTPGLGGTPAMAPPPVAAAEALHDPSSMTMSSSSGYRQPANNKHISIMSRSMEGPRSLPAHSPARTHSNSSTLDRRSRFPRAFTLSSSSLSQDQKENSRCEQVPVCNDCKGLVMEITNSTKRTRSSARNRALKNLTLDLSPVYK